MSIMASQMTCNSLVCSSYQTKRWEKNQSWLLVLYEGNPPVTDGFPSQRASNMESVFMSMSHSCNARFLPSPRGLGQSRWLTTCSVGIICWLKISSQRINKHLFAWLKITVTHMNVVPNLIAKVKTIISNWMILDWCITVDWIRYYHCWLD